jgi:hypothetical protein
MTVREVGVEIRRPIVQEVVAPPPVVVERRPRVAVAAQERRFTQPMEVEIEYREHIRYPDGHVEHSRPRFEHVDRERYLATHPEGYVEGGRGYVRQGGPIVVDEERGYRGGGAPIVVPGERGYPRGGSVGGRRPIVA